MHPADILVLLFYFVVIIVIGMKTAQKIKSSEDFFMPRKFGKLMMIMFSFGTGTHSDQAVSVAAKSYSNGLSGIWYQWLWLPVTPFYWLIAPLFRRFRAITTAQVFEARYNHSVALLYAIVGILSLTINIGIMLKGSGEVISASTTGLINTNVAIAIMTVLFVVYGVAGGLSAAILTDFIQGILTIIFSFLLLPLVLNAVGGLEGLRSQITDPQMLSLVAPSDIGFFYIAVIAFNGLVGIVTQPHTMSNCGAGKTELEGRIGFMVGSLIKRLCTIAWALTGLTAVVYFAGRDIAPDHVFGAVAGEFLPRLMPGMLGVFIAAILASVMSSCDAFMIASSALFTEDFYKRLWPKRSTLHYVWIGRIASVIVVTFSVAFAFWLPSVVKGLEIFWIISSMMGIAFWLGLFWRRSTSAGAWAATFAAFFAWWLTTQGFFISFLADIPIATSWRFVVERNGALQVYLPWQMIFYLAVGMSAGIIVSWLTKPSSNIKLDNFYALVRTPVRKGEDITGPCTLPTGSVVPNKRKLIPLKNWEALQPSRTSVLGFLIGWILVILLVGIVVIIQHSLR